MTMGNFGANNKPPCDDLKRSVACMTRGEVLDLVRKLEQSEGYFPTERQRAVIRAARELMRDLAESWVMR
jgi:hypothetical protein